MNIVETIFSTGDDALGTEFLVTLGPLPYLDLATGLTLRVTTVEIPETALGTYEYDYKSVKIVKPNGKDDTAREFSIEFRVDKYYAVYKAFKAWSAALMNPVTGGNAGDNPLGITNGLRIPISIGTGTFDIDGNFFPTTQVWNFSGCFPTRISGVTLDNQSAEPLMCSVTFNFLKMVSI